MIKDITAIILAGGKNARMGQDKSFLEFSGKPAIEIIINTLKLTFAELMIITNSQQSYLKYKVETHSDLITDRGPLAGIYTGLSYSNSDFNFFTTCDAPFLSKEIIEHIAGKDKDYDAIVPEFNGRLQPLCALYSKACLPAIKAALSKGELKAQDVLSHFKVKKVPEEELKEIDREGKSFLNINTPSEYEQFK